MTYAAVPLDGKQCPRCNQFKPRSSFHKCKDRRDGLHTYCRRCLSEQRRLRLATDPTFRQYERELQRERLAKPGRVERRNARYRERWAFEEGYRDRKRHNTRQWQLENPTRVLCWSARKRAKRLGKEFDLTPDDIVIPKFCPVLGIPLVWRGKAGVDHGTPSIDRIDNNRGYTPDNIAIISYRANTLKSNGTLDEFTAIVAYLKDAGKCQLAA